MRQFTLPYGKGTIQAGIEEQHLAGVLTSGLHSYQPEAAPAELVQASLEHPIGTPRLCELAAGKSNIVVISSDHTRPVPGKVIMPLLLKEIRMKNPEASITILISTGLHRETTKEELIDKFGTAIVTNETIVIHDCDDADNLIYYGKLPSGGSLSLNRIAADASLMLVAQAATVQITAAIIVTAILCPLLTSFLHKIEEKRRVAAGT